MQLPTNRKSGIVYTWLSILAGNALLAFLVAAFVLPHDFIMGGTTGIGILLNRFFGIDTAVLVLVFNLILLAFGGIVLGKRFFLTTVASSVLYPVLLGIFERIPGIDSFTDNTMLAAVFAGCLMGIALGLVMRVGSSTGGTDVVNLVMHKWLHWPLSVCVYVVDIVVLAGQAIFSKPEPILYGIILLVIETIVLDQVVLLGQSQIQIFAVSDQYARIRDMLLTALPAGVTMVQIETGRLGKAQQGVLCVIPPRLLHDTIERIQSIDPGAFLTVTRIKEVHGRGFTQERLYLTPIGESEIN